MILTFNMLVSVAVRRALATTPQQPCRLFHQSTAARGLLKNVDPILSGSLLKILRDAGHGDRIVFTDCNFPAAEVSSHTVTKELVTLAGVDLPTAVDACCSLLPLDYFVDCPVEYMVPESGGSTPPLADEVHNAVKAVVAKHADGVQTGGITRHRFYDEARKTFAVVQCVAERRPYGNVILTKGVIGPDGKDLKP